MKKLTIVTVVGGIVYFLLGWLVFEGILGDFMNTHTTQLVGFKKGEDMNLIHMFVSCVAYALLLGLVLGNWLNLSSIIEGIKKSTSIGILVAIMTDLYWFSSTHYFNGWLPIFVDIVAAGLTVGVTGGVIVCSWNKFA